jgi:N-methylhydantoinase A
VPAVAGLFSAVGHHFARQEFNEVRTCHLDVDAVEPTVVAGLFAEMEDKLAPALEGRSEVEWARTADLRYGGQSWEVEVAFPAGSDLAALRVRFEDEHERLYGVKDQAGSPVEIRALRLTALGEAAATRSFRLEANAAGSNGATRRIDDTAVPVRTRASVGEVPERGPLLVDEYDTTVVVPPGWSVRRDPATGTLLLERDGD